jgi:hypothetical protein
MFWLLPLVVLGGLAVGGVNALLDAADAAIHSLEQKFNEAMRQAEDALKESLTKMTEVNVWIQGLVTIQESAEHFREWQDLPNDLKASAKWKWEEADNTALRAMLYARISSVIAGQDPNSVDVNNPTSLAPPETMTLTQFWVIALVFANRVRILRAGIPYYPEAGSFLQSLIQLTSPYVDVAKRLMAEQIALDRLSIDISYGESEYVDDSRGHPHCARGGIFISFKDTQRTYTTWGCGGTGNISGIQLYNAVKPRLQAEAEVLLEQTLQDFQNRLTSIFT